MDQEIRDRLDKLAINRAIPFCYSCYRECPTGRCEHCGSDDLMLSLPEVGCEYGTSWVIQHILETELTPANLEEAFEEMVRECYPETTKVAWAEFDTVGLLKDQDPISWRCALSDYESQEESEGNIFAIDGSAFFWHSDVERLLGGV